MNAWKRNTKIVLSFVLILSFIMPAQAGGSMDVNVNIPFAELYQLLDALKATGQELIGAAGVEMRATIDELSAQIEARMTQIKEMGEELWKMMYNDISKEIAGIKSFLLKFTTEVNRMVKERIDQIDGVLANRIDQLSNMLNDTITQLDGVIQRTIESARDASIDIINVGEKSIITVLDNAAVSIVRMILIILLIIVLLVILILAWKNVLPKSLPAIIISSVVGVIFVGLSLTFILSNKAMSYIFGRKIELAEAKGAEQKGDNSYNDFLGMVKVTTPVDKLKVSGRLALNNLLVAKYTAKDPATIKSLNDKIMTVNTLLFPPPKPDSGIKLGTFTKDYTQKLKIITDNAIKLKIKPDSLYLSPKVLDTAVRIKQ